VQQELPGRLRVFGKLPDGIGVRMDDGNAPAGQPLGLKGDVGALEDGGIGVLGGPAGPVGDGSTRNSS